MGVHTGCRPFLQMQNHRCLLLHGLAVLVLVVLGGCAGARHSQPGLQQSQSEAAGTLRSPDFQIIRALQNDLAALNQHADEAEARQVAQTAVIYSRRLAEKYELVRPAVFHNLLVRVGLKKRGLCYHWTEDLLERLQALKLKTYRLYWGVAHRGSELSEHNSVIIAARGQGFERGIILDPWRNSGDLFWCPVHADSYPWQPRPLAEW